MQIRTHLKAGCPSDPPDTGGSGGANNGDSGGPLT